MGKQHRQPKQSTQDTATPTHSALSEASWMWPNYLEAAPSSDVESETQGWFGQMVGPMCPVPSQPAAAPSEPEWAPKARFQYGDSYAEDEEAWTENNLRARIGYTDGLASEEYKPKAAAIMRDLLVVKTPKAGDYPDVLYALADLRDYDDSEIEAMWDVYAEAKAEQVANQKPEDPVPGLDDRNSEHMASLAQLRFGSYVADTLGGRAGVDLDPVFGALLSPTGGLVGPGNAAYAAKDLSPDGMHGEAHDAFGYLSAHHGATISPGYTYADLAVSPEGAQDWQGNSNAPLSGQISGFALWKRLLAEEGHADPRSVSDIAEDSMLQVFRAGHPDMPGHLPSWLMEPAHQEILYDIITRPESTPLRTGGTDKLLDGAEKLMIDVYDRKRTATELGNTALSNTEHLGTGMRLQQLF